MILNNWYLQFEVCSLQYILHQLLVNPLCLELCTIVILLWRVGVEGAEGEGAPPEGMWHTGASGPQTAPCRRHTLANSASRQPGAGQHWCGSTEGSTRIVW